jgi:hypothetical protein
MGIMGHRERVTMPHNFLTDLLMRTELRRSLVTGTFSHHNIGDHRGVMCPSISSNGPVYSAPHPLHVDITLVVSIDHIPFGGDKQV